MAMEETSYPISFTVEYPDRQLARLSTAFRLLLAIPILIVLTAVSGAESGGFGEEGRGSIFAAGGFLFLGPLLMIVFRQKYPRWWFDWNLGLARFSSRVGAYLALMDDHYPSTDEEQSVRLDMTFPDVPQDLNRWLPLIKWLLALPHYIVLIFLYVALIIVVSIAWFAILFTGRYPRGLFAFSEGVLRWTNRVAGYAFLLVTDRYPPFRLSP